MYHGDSISEEAIMPFQGGDTVNFRRKGDPLREDSARAEEESFLLEIATHQWNWLKEEFKERKMQMDFFTL